MNQKIEAGLASILRPTSLAPERNIASASAERAPALPPVRACDSLRLTGEAAGLQVLHRELSAAPAIDEARVAAVREALDTGTYQINPDHIAQRMLALDEALHA